LLLLTSTDSKGGVLGVDGLLVVLELVVGHVEGQVVADEGGDGADLNGSEFPLAGRVSHGNTMHGMIWGARDEEDILACLTPCTTVW
jgi:hypothetical protein